MDLVALLGIQKKLLNFVVATRSVKIVKLSIGLHRECSFQVPIYLSEGKKILK